MKKIISLTIVIAILLQMNLPIFSYGVLLKDGDTPETIIELDEKIKQYLIDEGFDEDDNKELSIAELENVTELDIDCDDEDVDLTGIEYMTGVTKVTLVRSTPDMNYGLLENLPNLDTLSIAGFFTNLSFLPSLVKLETLELRLWDNNCNPFDILSTLTNLKALKLSINSEIDTSKLANLTNLTDLYIEGDEESYIGLAPLSSLTKLKLLELKRLNLSNLNGLENIQSLDTLMIGKGSSAIDTDAILLLENLTTLELVDYVDTISWVDGLASLEQLRLRYWDGSIEVTQDFLDEVNELEVQDLDIQGIINHNIGEINPDELVEIELSSIPVVNEMMNSNGRLYYENFQYEFDNSVNEISLDEQNKKISLVASEDKRRDECIMFYNGVTIRLNWSFPVDSVEPELNPRLKEGLLNEYADLNYDGVLSKKELEDENLRFVYVNFYDGDEVNLTGIENVKNLEEISIYINTNSVSEIDLSVLKSLENLRRLTINGYINEIDSLAEVTQLRELRVSSWTGEFSLNPTVLNCLTNLESIELEGLQEQDANKIASLTALTNLKKMKLSFNSSSDQVPFNVANLSAFTNLEELNISDVDTSSLATLKTMTKLKFLALDSYSYYGDNADTIDIATLKELSSLETLRIVMPEDVSWINDLTELNTIIFDVRAYGTNAHDLDEDFINTLKNINAKVVLNGGINYSMGYFPIGTKIDYNLNNNILIKELLDPNSNLYAPNINMSAYYYGYSSTNEFEYNNQTREIDLTINQVGQDSCNVFLSDNRQNGTNFNLNLTWFGTQQGDTDTPIEFNDENLKNALLADYDIDGNGKITEYDMVNIEELYLDNKNITDMTGLENAINANYIILTNNHITDLTIARDMISANKNTYINLRYNDVEDITNVSDADFECMNLSYNFIDFSEGTQNRQVIVDYITQKYGTMYDEDEDFRSGYSSKEECIADCLDMYFEWNASNQRVNQFVKGDVNGNGIVELTDYTMILKHVKGIKLLEGEQLQRADVNQNGDVELTDYTMVLKHVKGIKLLD